MIKIAIRSVVLRDGILFLEFNEDEECLSKSKHIMKYVSVHLNQLTSLVALQINKFCIIFNKLKFIVFQSRNQSQATIFSRFV